MKLFGTDGVRGRFGSEPITPQTILKLGWCIGSVIREQDSQPCNIVIGKDTRISGYIMESAVSSGLLFSGANIRLLGPVPTPAVSFFCRETHASAGIVISASHNPSHDNGLKLLCATGEKLPGKVERLIEAKMRQSIEFDGTKSLGKATRVNDVVKRYSDFLCSSAEARLDGLRIVVDCANGASYRVAPKVLSKLGADVIVLSNKPDGYNINRECGSTSPEFIRRNTLNHKADVGIALDGDGDRVIMVDSEGNLINGDQLLFVIAMARKREMRLHGGVVGTQLSNLGLERAFAENDIPFKRTKVGDRFIARQLAKRDWKLGGEESGHILNGDTGMPGDGLAAALEVLSEMQKTGCTLNKLVEGVQLVPQVTVNVLLNGRTAPLSGLDLTNWPNVSTALEVAESTLNNHGRILVRASGTEPMIRILVEGEDRRKIDQIANYLADAVREESQSNQRAFSST